MLKATNRLSDAEPLYRRALANVEWVERMKGKHDDLPTNVLYSRSGFTKGAKKKAQTYRKGILALETLDARSAERLFGGTDAPMGALGRGTIGLGAK